MKKIKCVIADDELLSQEIIENYISRLDKLSLIAKCKNGIEVFNALKVHDVDLLFLDIQMPDLTGIELMKTIKNPPPIIFTTAYREFALEGYELNILDYLLKPISFERFLKSIDKFENSTRPSKAGSVSNIVDGNKDLPAFIYVKSDKKMLKIFLSDILFIEGMKDYVRIKTVQQEIVTYQTLTHLEQQLPDSLFLRIHRSFIVAIDKIYSFTTSFIEIGNRELPIGNYYQQNVMKALKVF